MLATGTGKTRVAVALVELLQRQERIQRVLFLADRRELVKQALAAFKEHLPGSPRSWIEGGTIDKDAQIRFAAYPGMMSIYHRLSPGYYDLIIADESHRSIYEKKSYGGIFDHFDSLLLGLTATPTDFLDHNTFQLFDCPDDSPTFYYGYDEAVRDKYLVPYRPVHVARTGLQIEGLKPGELPAEVSHQVREQGVDPDQFSFEFCLGGKESVLPPLKAIAAASLVARRALYEEFCRQNKVKAMLDAGGNFQDFNALPEFTSQLADEVKRFFKRCYEFLSTDKNRNWKGYELNGSCSITNLSYKDDFCSYYPTYAVCPYCDGEIGTPQLDHYLCKSDFPLFNW